MKTYGTLTLLQPSDQVMRFRPMWRLDVAPHMAVRVKRIFARTVTASGGVIGLNHTKEVARDLEWVSERWPLEMKDEDRAFLIEEAEGHRDSERVLESILNGGGSLGGDGWREPIIPPREYQRVASDVILSTGRLLVGDALGLGKTFTGLLTLRHPESTPALIVAPTHLQQQWVEQLGKFFPLLTAHRIRTSKPYDPASRREMRGYDPDVLITTYAKLAGWSDYLKGRVRTVVFDEMQELRIAGTQKYLGAEQVASGAAFRIGLTATPVYNHGGEAYNIINLLQPDALGTAAEFAREWGGTTDNRGRTMVKDPAALGTYLRDQGLFLRRTRADVGRELPPVSTVTHTVDVDAAPLQDIQAAVRALAETVLNSSDGKAVFKASGDLDWRIRRATGLAKAPHVADFVRLLLESEEKVAVFGWHRDVYETLVDRLADMKPVLYTGSESPTQKAESARRFKEDEDCRVFVMSLRSGAGLDGLQEVCNVAVFAELDWAPGVHDQCIGRFNRDGQTDPVFAYYAVAESGSDPVVAEALGIKRMQSEGIHNPDGQLFEPVPASGDRMKRLAAQVLGHPVSPESTTTEETTR